MNRVVAFQIFLSAILISGALFGFLGWERAGQAFLAIGIIDLLMSVAAWRGWPILRGDISNQAPLSAQDSGELPPDGYALENNRPSKGFIVTVAALGILALGIGLTLLLFFA